MAVLLRRGATLMALGLAGIAVLFAVYGRYQDPQFVTPDAIDDFQRMASGFYVALLLLFGAISYGLYRYHESKARGPAGGLLSVIAQATWNRRSRKIFAVTFAVYGVFFSLVSGTLVYQPEVVFSYHYGADIPSLQVIPCCDAPGYMPKILVYLTEHVGLQIIPVNLVLQVMVSYLVGLNASMASGAYAVSRKKRGLGGVGAVTGLFVACPTCMGSFLSVFVGTASGIALTVALVHLQTLFIIMTIPVLALTPFALARKLQGPDGACLLR